MNKLNLSLIAVVISITQIFAQKPVAEKPIRYPTGVFNIGVGYSAPYITGVTDKLTTEMYVNPTITIEKAAKSARLGNVNGVDVNPFLNFLHNFTVGASVMYNKSYYVDSSITVANNEPFRLDITLVYVNARTSYHFLKRGLLDVYVGVGAGYVYAAAKDNAGNIYAGYGITTPTSGFGYSAFGGLRFMPTKRLGLYVEGGYTSLALVSGGITFGVGKIQR